MAKSQICLVGLLGQRSPRSFLPALPKSLLLSKHQIDGPALAFVLHLTALSESGCGESNLV